MTFGIQSGSLTDVGNSTTNRQPVQVRFAKGEQLMTRQEADFARFEKILDTWEQQQKQYQKYLDSLAK